MIPGGERNSYENPGTTVSFIADDTGVAIMYANDTAMQSVGAPLEPVETTRSTMA